MTILGTLGGSALVRRGDSISAETQWRRHDDDGDDR